MCMKKIVFDIDGTICEERRTQEKCIANPNSKIISLINKLYKKNFIILYTARGWDQYTMTEWWCKKHNVKYHLLLCGKPIYDYWIDDRAFNVSDASIYEKLLLE